ncbi:hypothetical protein BDL97_17G110800 [Sphagnum fallax]|nr:hypothetical protein BDL97_17G110800 [Sphagnum fallax]
MSPRYEWHHPIVLIGHSFGGLVLKSLVVKLKREPTIRNPTNSLSKATVQRAKVFLRNVRGVAFYAVPHAGSSNIAKYVNKLLRCNNRHHPGIMDNEIWNSYQWILIALSLKTKSLYMLFVRAGRWSKWEFWWVLARHNDQHKVILTWLRMPIIWRYASPQVKNIPAMSCFNNLSLLVKW